MRIPDGNGSTGMPCRAGLLLGLTVAWAAGCVENALNCPSLEAGADDGGNVEVEGGSDAGADAAADADAEAEAEAEADAAPAECGNGVIEADEQCDGAELGGASCASLGLTPGTLACDEHCRFDTAGCAVCGDGRCEGGETPLTCATECAVVDVSAGAIHTCAVLADGSVRCWGARRGHQAGGIGDVTRPVRVPGIADASKVAAGVGHTCVLHEGGTVSCWGRSGFGECGEIAARVWPPRAVPDLTGATALAAAEHHTCALLADRSVRCWGRGDFGNLGDGSHPGRSATPVRVTSATPFDGLAAGAQHTCASASGVLRCWGRNDMGQVGGNDRDWHPTPVVTFASATQSFGVGGSHGCGCQFRPSMPPALQGLYCWGNNGFGQVGVPASSDVLGPQRVGPGCPRAVDGGDAFTCMLLAVPGPVQCWGGNSSGQLGDGTQVSRHTLALVAGIDNAVQVSAGASHACARLQDGTLRCWGRNVEGQNGNGTSARYHVIPVEPVGL